MLTEGQYSEGEPIPSTAKLTISTPGRGRGQEKECYPGDKKSHPVLMGRGINLLSATLDLGTLHILGGRFQFYKAVQDSLDGLREDDYHLSLCTAPTMA